MRRLWLCSMLATGATVACSHAPVQTAPAPSSAKTTGDASALVSSLYYLPKESPPTSPVSQQSLDNMAMSLEHLLYYFPKESPPPLPVSQQSLDNMAMSLERLLYYVPDEPPPTPSASPDPFNNFYYVPSAPRPTPLR